MMKRLLSDIVVLLAGGCASMNESECVNADWRMIGFEDGSVGRTRGYIGEHRQACAKHDITPDLDSYNSGHAEGVRGFCVEANGFRFGRSGGTYSGICPYELEEEFLIGYRRGKDLHSAEQAVHQINAVISDYKRQIKSAEAGLKIKEDLLVSDESTEETRRTLLDEIKDLRKKLEDLQAFLGDAEQGLVARQTQLAALKQSMDY